MSIPHEVKRTLKTVEPWLEHQSREWGIIVDPKTGKVLAKIGGTSNHGLEIPAKDVPKLEGSIFIHNHPKKGRKGDYGWGFSKQDLSSTVDVGSVQLRVVGMDWHLNKPCVYVMTMPEGGWGVSQMSLEQAFDNLADQYTQFLNQDTELDDPERTYFYYHSISKDLAQKYGWKYWLEYL